MNSIEKYQKGKIYAIKSYSTDKVYIGGTIEKLLSRRLSKHRTDKKRYEAGKVKKCTTSIKILSYDDYYIELIENYPCTSKHELDVRERYYIQLNDNCVNKCIPTRSRAEYRQDNLESIREKEKIYASRPEIKEIRKLYHEENKEIINEKKRIYRSKPETKEKDKKYREANKDHITEVRNNYEAKNKDRRKEIEIRYHKRHREERNAKHKIYCETHKEELAEKAKQRSLIKKMNKETNK